MLNIKTAIDALSVKTDNAFSGMKTVNYIRKKLYNLFSLVSIHTTSKVGQVNRIRSVH